MTNKDTLLTYFKCGDCLSAFTSHDAPTLCLCGGKVRRMGRVHERHYQDTTLMTPCDDRCTNAAGPNCDCQCGGANHGTQRLVSVVVNQGTVRVTHMTNARVEQGREYRDLVEKANRLIPKQAYQPKYWYDLSKICGMKVYKTRQERLLKLISLMEAEAAVKVA